MAQARNTFIKSKLNKDLDARLLPQGEYRDAINIQVSKSESSTVGSLENIRGNFSVLDVKALTGISDLRYVGEFADESSGYYYLFVTNNFQSRIYNKNKENFIIRYDSNSEGTSAAKVLVKGAFLNFSTDFKIYGINLLEGLLFWTDNYNQPRVINVSLAENDGSHYLNEDQISVAKYNPYQPIELWEASASSTDAVPYESTMKDVTSKFYPNGGEGSLKSPLTGSPTAFTLNSVIGYIQEEEDSTSNPSRPFIGTPKYGPLGSPISYVDTDGAIVSTGTTVKTLTFNETSTEWVIAANSALTLPAAGLPIGAKIIFNANLYFDPTFAGDADYLESKFIRFSYRFKFEDNEYSVLAPFTQIAFIPKQDGYFMYQPNYLNSAASVGSFTGLVDLNDQDDAFASTIVSFVENKVDSIKLKIPLPSIGTSLQSDFKIQELDILFKESDGLAVRVIDTIPINDIVLNAAATNVFSYNYLSKKPYKTLPSSELTRVYDKVPVRAFAQEISSNRIMYGNFQDKHTPLTTIDYSVNVSAKKDFDLQTGTITIATGNTYAANTPIVVAFTGTVNVGSPTSLSGVSIVAKDLSASTVNFNIAVTLTTGQIIEVSPIGPDQNYVSKIEYPNSSVKQNRNYQVGIVLSDKFGRTSSVILSNNKTLNFNAATGQNFLGDTIYSAYSDEGVDASTWPGDSLKVLFNEPLLPTTPIPSGNLKNWPGIYNGISTSDDYNPLGWFSYKIVVKQTEQEYYNVYLPGIMAAYPRNVNLEISRTSHTVLIGDNINKVPRDLSLVGPEQKQFRSSVQLFGRVENAIITPSYTGFNTPNPQRYGDTNTQYYTGRESNTVATVSTMNDLFDYSSILPPSPNYFPQFYQYESNPLIARIVVPKQIGQISTTNYDIASSAALQDQTTANAPVGASELLITNIVGDIVIGDFVQSDGFADNLIVSDVGTNASNQDFIKIEDTAGVPRFVTVKQGQVINFIPAMTLTAADVDIEVIPGIQYLSVYETEPVESLLDIYWEASSVGLISDLNSLILNASGGGGGLSTTNLTNWDEGLADGGYIFNANFTVVDSFENPINQAFLTVVLESVFDESNSGEGVNVQLGVPYFILKGNTEDSGIPLGFFNIAITTAYFNEIYFGSDAGVRNFNFNIKATVNNGVDDPVVSNFNVLGNPSNVFPSFISGPGNNDIIKTSRTASTNLALTKPFATYDIVNGSANKLTSSGGLQAKELSFQITAIAGTPLEGPYPANLSNYSEQLMGAGDEDNTYLEFNPVALSQSGSPSEDFIRGVLRAQSITSLDQQNLKVSFRIGDPGDTVTREIDLTFLFQADSKIGNYTVTAGGETDTFQYTVIEVVNFNTDYNGFYLYAIPRSVLIQSNANPTGNNVLALNHTSRATSFSSCPATATFNNPVFATTLLAAKNLFEQNCYPAGGGENISFGPLGNVSVLVVEVL